MNGHDVFEASNSVVRRTTIVAIFNFKTYHLCLERVLGQSLESIAVFDIFIEHVVQRNIPACTLHVVRQHGVDVWNMFSKNEGRLPARARGGRHTGGLGGGLLLHLHGAETAGMTPVNHWWEAGQQVLFSSVARFIALFYVVAWDRLIAHEHKNPPPTKKD